MNTNVAPLQGLANNMAQHGRYGDSMLVHMNPHEVEGIASLSPTGQLTRNPMTGQPEAFLPFLAPLLGGALGLGSLGTAALGGAMTALQTGDLRKGILSGVTGFGLGKLFEFAGGAKDLAGDALTESTAALTEAPSMIDPSKIGMSSNILEDKFSDALTNQQQALTDISNQSATPWWAREGKTLGDEGFFDDLTGRLTSKEALPGMLIAGTAGSELGRLETQEDLERQMEEDKLSQEAQVATSEEEIQRAMRQRIYDYGLPARNIQPRDPRYAPTAYANRGGLVSLNPMDYQNKRDGLSRLMGEPVRMQSGGYTPDIKASEAQSALRGSQLISAPQMQQLSASGYRPGFGPELQYFREPDRFGNDPFAGYLDPMNPNAPVVPTAGQLESEAAAAAAAASQAANNQSYAPAPTSDPLNFVSSLGGDTKVRHLGGTAPDLVSGIPSVGQGYVSDFGGETGGSAGIMQNLDYSDYPKRSDFGSSEDGGHIEFKQAENEWWQSKTPSAFIDQPVMPFEATSPVMPPEAISPVVPMPPPPPIIDTSALPPQEIAPVPPPPAVMPTMPKRSDYGSEEGMDYRNDLNAYRSVATQPTPPVMPAPMPPPPPMMQPPPPAIIENLMRPEIAPPMPIPPPIMPPQAVAPPPPVIQPPVMQPPVPMPPPIAPPPVQSMPQPVPLPLPTRQPVTPPPPLPELGPRPKRSDYGREDRYDYQYDLREWNEAKKAREEMLNRSGGGIINLAKGGLVKMQDMGQVPEIPIDPAMMQADPMQEGIAAVDPAMQDPTAGIDPAALQLVEQTAMAVLGQVPPEQADAIIQAFIEQFGPEAFQALRQEVLNSVEPGAQTEGMIQGQGDGMSDEIQGMIGDQQRVAVSPGEYIVPADVVSGIGNGSSDSGANQLDSMMDEIRQARTGMTQQPPAIDPRGAMPV